MKPLMIEMNSKDTRSDITEYGRALVKLLLGFDTVEPKAKWFERLLIKLLRVNLPVAAQSYYRRGPR